MDVLPLTAAAARLGVAQQTLSYYLKKGKLTATKAGGVWLVDPEVAKTELEAAGFYERREVLRNGKKRRERQAQTVQSKRRRRQP
jgi:predicted site-specific integrase-resolvase